MLTRRQCRRNIQCLCALATLLFMFHTAYNSTADQNRFKKDSADSGNETALKWKSTLGAALSLQATLSDLHERVTFLSRHVNSSSVPALIKIDLQMLALEVADTDARELHTFLLDRARIIIKYSTVLIENLKTLMDTVQVVISDLWKSNIDPAIITKLRNLMCDLEVTFTTSIYVVNKMNSKIIRDKVLDVLGNEKDERRSEIKTTLLIIEGDFMTELEDIMTIKNKYDVMKTEMLDKLEIVSKIHSL